MWKRPHQLQHLARLERVAIRTVKQLVNSQLTSATFQENHASPIWKIDFFPNISHCFFGSINVDENVGKSWSKFPQDFITTFELVKRLGYQANGLPSRAVTMRSLPGGRRGVSGCFLCAHTMTSAGALMLFKMFCTPASASGNRLEVARFCNEKSADWSVQAVPRCDSQLPNLDGG